MDSNLKMYSLGKVSEDATEDNPYINIFPIEEITDFTGDLTEIDNISEDIKNASDEYIVSKINKEVTIRAKWLNGDNINRVSPPNICKGETVRIYRYGDTDKYFWETLYNEIDLRKNEKVITAFSNRKTIDEEVDLNKMYYYTFDTINKLVKLHTSTNDGEPTTYDITLDTGDGILEVIDGEGNQVKLESMDGRLYVNINKEIVADVGNRVEMNVKNDMDINLKKFAVSNGSDELMKLFAETLQAIIDEKHVGNLNVDTVMTGDSQAVFEDIKGRVEAFIK